MCGIIGASGGADHAHDMLKAIKHRGPDGSNIKFMGAGFIGHARLHVTGSIEGTQPFVYGNNPRTYAVNGEIYNSVLWLDSDSELVARLPPEKLIGEFAYASMEDGSSVELVRDRFGVKPLFYYWKPGFFAYASEISALLEHPEVDQTLADGWECSQFVNMVVPDTTMFKHIFSVPPGSKVHLTRKSINIEKYWEFPHSLEWCGVTNEQLVDALTEAVEIRTKTPTLSYVSSGMDGQIIYDLSKNSSLTMDFKDGDHFEEARWKLHQPNANLTLKNAKASFRTIYNPIGAAKWRMAREANDLGFKSIIGGQGADELFCGYQFLNSESWSELSNPDERISHPTFRELFGYTPQMFAPWLKLFYSSVFWESNSDYDPFQLVAEKLRSEIPKGLDRTTEQQMMWIRTHFESQILLWGCDRPESHHGIEGRLPFLDLVDLAMQIRPEDRANKKRLREAFSKPAPKRSFMSPYTVSEFSCKLLKRSLRGPLADVAYWQYETLRQLRDVKNPGC